MTGLGHIIRLAWEHVCPYEIYWGIEETERPPRSQWKNPPRTLLSAIMKSPQTALPVVPKKALWPR
jgi:hypothetical protein